MLAKSTPSRSAYLISPGASFIGNPDTLTNTVKNCTSLNYNYENAPKEGVRLMQELGYLSVVENNKSDILFSPNPTSDFIEINLDRWTPPSKWSPASSDIKIYSVLGGCVMTTLSLLRNATPPMEGNFRIDVSQLPAGVYFVRFNNKALPFVKY